MSEPANSIRVGILAEIHHAPAGTPRTSWHNELLLDRSDELLGRAVAELARHEIDALVLLGDLTNDADDGSFAAVRDKTPTLDCPVLAVPGNHDIDEPGALACFAVQLSDAPFLSAPEIVQHHPGMATILVAIERDGSTNMLHSSAFPDLRPLSSQTLLVFSHYPVLPMEPRLRQAGLKHAGDLSDRRQIQERLLSHDGPVIVVHGHLHVRAAEARPNVLHLSCAALVEPPHEVSYVSISGDPHLPIVRFEAVSIMTSNVDRLPILAPANQEWRFANGQWSQRSDVT